VGEHRVLGAEHPPHQLARERDRHGRGVLRDLLAQGAGGAEQVLFRVQAAQQPALETLLRVFDVYGQSACTSPRRVVLPGARREEALRLRDRLAAIWTKAFPRPPETIVASTGLLDDQWARMEGWDSRLVRGHGAALAVGNAGMTPPAGQRILPLMPMTIPEALESVPANIQTVGHALSPERERELASRLAARGALRFVPVAEMHHFGPVWDGRDYWRRTFAVEAAR